MAENQEQMNMETLREELANLKQQIEHIVRTADNKRTEVSGDIIDKLTRELENLRKSAMSRAHKVYESGQAGVEELGDRVRRNPLASLAIAFGAGCVLSCIVRHLR